MSVFWSLVSVLLLVGANGFFVAAEFALVTVRRTRIDQLAHEGVSAARHVRKALGDLDRYIAGTQVGITIASLALGWIGEPAVMKLLAPVFHWLAPDLAEKAQHAIGFAISFTLITFLHVILGELVPKSIALTHPESTSLFLARPMRIAIILFKPLIWSLNGLGHMLLRAIGLPGGGEHGSVHSPAELLLLIRQSHAAGHIDSFERSMLQKTFRFSETAVSEVMTPRARVEALNLNQPLDALLDEASHSPYTRLPVYRESVDELIGVLYTHDLFQFSRQKLPGVEIKDLVKPLLYVPESYRLDTLVRKFQNERTQIAAVIDEYGGTAGIITLEDIIETVFGEVQDNNEDPTIEIDEQADGSIVLRGDTRLQLINEQLGWNLQDEESTTIAGYILTALGRMPKVGETLKTDAGIFEVLEMKKHRLTKIKLLP
ncbi:MAG TPA: hemolysin family protein [Oligoflexus sp.]|uniref:hemolysin family protein n=1 Tax=Oligoflexus sp. TaxID=1971216 RepID=UPI002D2AE63A|nr:hemolysin family protein [Oligoflexus sp.]HYX38043.1 hemolysin family protein [Oligoflexus sp.]